MILVGHAYFLRFDPKLWDAMQPYTPLGTLYAAAAIRASGLHVERLEPTRLPGHPLIRPAIAGSASRG